MRKKKKYTSAQKAKIALGAVKGQSTINEISQRFGVHSPQILRWKKQLLECQHSFLIIQTIKIKLINN